ncbi:MAG TPA: antibiotic biosynthesis monooxygenase [Ktedonobacterales bacterium]|nr:antibiotic biosynthesis monooxygenase [Ktedonobacterales bacterium]
MNRLEVIARMKVRPGQLDGFKRQVAELVRVAREQDTGTLRWDWFLSRDGTECEVHEAYASSESMIEHAGHIKDARNKLFAEFAEGHEITVYGEPSPEFFEMAEGMQKAGIVKVTWFSFLQGLPQPAGV